MQGFALLKGKRLEQVKYPFPLMMCGTASWDQVGYDVRFLVL